MKFIKGSQSLGGASALFGAAIIYASFGVLIREMAKMFGNNAQVAFRFAVAFIVLSAVFFIRKKSVRLPRKAIVKSLLLGLAFGGVLLLFTLSVNNTKIANSVFLLYSGSIISSLLMGTFFLKEKLNTIKVVAILLSLVGLAMYADALLAISVGVIAGFASGIVDGFANAIRKTLKGVDRNVALWYQFLIGTIFALVVTLVTNETAVGQVSLWPILVGVVFGLLQIALGNLLLYGFQHFDVNVGTVILACELLFSILFGFIFFSEIPANNELIGGLFIFFASILSAVNIKKLFTRLNIMIKA